MVFSDYTVSIMKCSGTVWKDVPGMCHSVILKLLIIYIRKYSLGLKKDNVDKSFNDTEKLGSAYFLGGSVALCLVCFTQIEGSSLGIGHCIALLGRHSTLTMLLFAQMYKLEAANFIPEGGGGGGRVEIFLVA